MQEIKDDILERTNQMISLCRNADTSANQTVMKLADQGEQLINIEINISTIDATLIDTKENINRLKGITQRVIGTFRTKFHEKIISKITQHSTKKQNSLSKSPPQRELTAKSIQHNIPSANSCMDEQIDEALYEIDNLLHSLKDKAYIINDQLVGQADKLDHIYESMKESTDQIQEQNNDIKKLNQ